MAFPRSSQAFLCLALGLLLVCCRPERNEQLEETSQAPGVIHPDVYRSSGTATGIALVIDESRQLCSQLQPETQNVHLICDGGASDPEGKALRLGLEQLRKEEGHSLGDLRVILLSSAGRGMDARALMARDPAFFGRVAVWTGRQAELIDRFGPTFLSHFSGKGAKELLLVGAPATKYGPWMRLAGRRGLHLALLDAETKPRVVLQRLLATATP